MYPLLRAKLNQAWKEIRSAGPLATVSRVYRAWSVGRRIEANGNRVEVAGLIISVDNRQIATRAKSILLTGSYERAELHLIERFLPRDYPVIELGGSIGVVACFTNRRLDRPAEHVVVEAHPALIPTLLENARLNGCQFKVINAVVAYDTQSATFYSGATFLAGSVRATEGGAYRVAAISLSRLLSQFDASQVCLVADIEGSEVELVEREMDLLKARVRWVIVETHGGAVGVNPVAQMLTTFADAGFVERGREGDVLALENAALTAAANVGP